MIKKAHFFFMVFFVVLAINSVNIQAQSNLKSESDLKKQAEKLFSSKDFLGAISLYSELLSVNQKNPNYNYKYGVCAMYSDKDKSKSLKYLELACRTPGVDNDAFFYLGKSYHLNYRFDDAIGAFEKYKSLARQADIISNDVNHIIEMCQNGKKVFTESVSLDIVEQKEMPVSAIYSGYELKALGGKILSTPAEFKSKVDLKKNENGTIYLSKENLTVYYSSYGEKDVAGKDIYKVVQLPTHEWSKPENVGAVLNTKYTEDYPFLCADGKTLYFSSEGHNSMGGLDIFKSEYDETTKTWSVPENLGYPINSTGDDVFYATGIAEPEYAWFSSNRETALGRMIVYKIRIKKALTAFITIKGKFTSIDKPDLKAAKISVFNIEKNELLGTYMSNPSSSDYLIKVAPGAIYNFVVEADGYLPHSENINIPPASSNITSMNQEITLRKDTTGEEMKVKNFFDPSSGVLAENMKPQEVTSTFKYDTDYKDKLKPVEIDGQIIYVTPPVHEAPINVQTATNNKDTTIKKSDFKGNISNNDIVKIAFDDAKETENEAIDLRKDADIASNIAAQRDSLAKAKGLEAQVAMVNAQKIVKPSEKQEALKNATILEELSNKMSKEAEVASQMAKQLSAQAQEKKLEADSAFANAKALDASISNNKGDHLALQAKIKKKKRKTINTTVAGINASDSTNTNLALKKKQAQSELVYSDRLHKEAEALREQVTRLKEKMANSKDEKERNSLALEISELERTAADKQKNADQYSATGQQLKDSVKTSEIASTISRQAEIKKDSLTKSSTVVSSPESKPDLPLVSINTSKPAPVEIKKTEENVGTQPDANPKTANKAIAENEKIKPDSQVVKAPLVQEIKIDGSNTVKNNLSVDSLAKVSVLSNKEVIAGNGQPSVSKDPLKNGSGTIDSITNINVPNDQSNVIAKQQDTIVGAKPKTISAGVLGKSDPEVVNYYKLDSLRIEKEKLSEQTSKEASLKEGEAAEEEAQLTILKNDFSKIKKKKEKAIKLASINELTLKAQKNRAEADSLKIRSNELNVEVKQKQQEVLASKLRVQSKEDSYLADSLTKIAEKNTVTSKEDEATAQTIIQKNRKIRSKKVKAVNQAEADILLAQSKRNEAKADSLYIVIRKLNADALVKKQEASSLFSPVTAIGKDSVKQTNESLRLAGGDTLAVTNPNTNAENKDAQKSLNPVAKDSTIAPVTSERPAISIKNDAKDSAVQPVENKTDTINKTANSSLSKNEGNQLKIDSAAVKVEKAEFKQQAEENLTEAQKLNNESKNDSIKAVSLLVASQTTVNDSSKIKALESKAYEAASLEKKQKAIKLYESAKALKDKSDKKSLDANATVPETVSNPIKKPGPISDASPVTKNINGQAEKSTSIFVGEESIYNDANPIPMDQPLPQGLIFKVQIGAFKKAIPQNTFKGIKPITGEKTATGFTRYTAGLFVAFESSNLVKKEIRSRGYKDAFVVAFYNGKRIPLNEAAAMVNKYTDTQKKSTKKALEEELKELKKNNIYAEKYSNQPDTDFAGNPISDANSTEGKNNERVSNRTLKYDGLIYTVQVGVYKSPNVRRKLRNLPSLNRDQLPNGLYRFTSGVFNYFDEADSARKICKSSVSDAFVIAIYKGQNITQVEGERLERTKPPVKIDQNINAENKNKGIVIAENIRFKVQLGAFKSQVPVEIIDKYLQLKGGEITNLKRNDLTLFYVGNVKDYDAAEKIKNEAIAAGLTDVFIVAFDGTKQITIKEAKEVLNK
jgi:hypothetical protein